MMSALVVSSDGPGAQALSTDLAGAGVHVLGACACDALVRESVRQAPDVVVCWELEPSDVMLEAIATLAANAPRPVALFTMDARAETAERALRSGVHELVVNGHAAHRLRSVLHVASARFRIESQRHEAMADLRRRYEERKLVDRAKGTLMRAQQMSEEEAFRSLRVAAMHGNQRLGQVAQQVIATARGAQWLNRSGQLRMLSQRIVKLQALLAAGCDVERSSALLQDSIERVEDTLKQLEQQVSRATFGDLLNTLLARWTALQSCLQSQAGAAGLPALDEAAELFLAAAQTLTRALSHAAGRPTLAIVDLCGRQRMLSQRLAKYAVLAPLLDDAIAAVAREAARDTMDAFDGALAELRDAPLSNPQIKGELEAATRAWQRMLAGVMRSGTDDGRVALARCSEELLDLFESLTGRYERSLGLLVGESAARR
jgi:AmiR/NasT family two-component response regulator